MILFDFYKNIYSEPQTIYELDVVKLVKRWQSDENIFEIETSGSTGTPKVINLTRSQILASAKSTINTFGLKPLKTAFCCLSIYKIAGLMMVVRAIEAKMLLTVVPPSQNPLEDHQTTTHYNFASFVPVQLQQILDNEATRNILVENFDKAKILIGGAGVSNYLLNRIQNLNISFIATYGMTETVSHVAIRAINGSAKSEYFSFLPEIKYDFDEDQCVKIYGACTNNSWVQTNDILEMVGPNSFSILGRRDRVINSGGNKIFLPKIESKIADFLQSKFNISNYFLTGIKNVQWGQTLCLVIEYPTLLKVDILAEIKKNVELNKHEYPKQIKVVPQFAWTESNKIDYIKTCQNYQIQ